MTRKKPFVDDRGADEKTIKMKKRRGEDEEDGLRLWDREARILGGPIFYYG